MSRCKPNEDASLLKDVGDLIREARSSPFQQLRIKAFKDCKAEDLCIAMFGDASHMNRAGTASTGGIIGVVAPPEFLQGETIFCSPFMWRSWKLTRRAVGTNDREIQSVHEAENQLYKARLLWGELKGAGWRHGRDWVTRADACVRSVTGALITDSRGSYDSVVRSESANLGMSSARAAVQAYAIKEALNDEKEHLIWVSGDWNLADALTKSADDCRVSARQFLRSGKWRIKFDENFLAGKKQPKSAAQTMADDADDRPHGTLWQDEICPRNDGVPGDVLALRSAMRARTSATL